MAEPTIQLGGGNWAGKSDNLLGYYKEGERFYKQDFTFSRSTTGTYTDSEGYIQEMPYNLASYSEDYTNSLQGASTTFGTITSPTSKLNASTITTTANGDYKGWFKSYTLIGSTDYTFSFYVKYNNKQWLSFYHIGSNITKFDVQNGVFGSNSIGMTKEDVGDGWYRLSGTITASSGTNYFYVYNSGQNDQDSSIGDAFYLFGIQLVKGTSAKTYFPTTTRLNMPRVDYLNNSNGSLILEPQRSNLVTYSSDFTEWDISTESTSTMTVTPNYTTAQNGLSASRLVATRPSTDFRSIISNYVTNTNTATKSVYIKNNNAGNVDINISDQAITVTDTWQRYELTNNYPHATIGLRYTGAALSCDISIAGYQFELGSYATSYIPTSGSSVTRNADVCSITNASDRIGQTQGTLYSEFDLTEDNNFTIVEINLSNSTSNRILAYRNASYIQFIVQVGGYIEINNSTLVTFLDTNKIAITYQANNFKIYLNGSLVKTYTSGSIPSSLDTVALQDPNLQGRKQGIKSLAIFKEILTSTELETLTTL